MAVDVAPASAQQMAELSEDELRVSLAIAALRPGGQSPLVNHHGEFILPASTPYSDAVLASLSSKGLLQGNDTLKPQWLQALSALAFPLWDLSLILGHHGQMTYDRYFSNGPLQSDSLVFYRRGQEESTHHIAFPYSPQYIMGLLDDTIMFNTPAGPNEASVELNYKEYIVLTALVDLFRKRGLESMLQHQAAEQRDITLSDVRSVLEEGLQNDDTRWLVALGNTVSPFEFALNDGELHNILEALQLRGFVGFTNGNSALTASESLTRMAESLLVIPSFTAFELTFIKSLDVFEINYFCAVRGLDGLWLFDFYELATPFPRVSLAAVSGEELSLMLQRLIEESKDKTENFLKMKEAQAKPVVTEATRLPSPPTLRSLKVPATIGEAKSPALEAAPIADPPPKTPVPIQVAAAPPEAPRSVSVAPALPPPVAAPPTVAIPAVSVPPEAEPAVPPLGARVVLGGQMAPASEPQEAPCPHCGLPVLVGKKFCRHCGKSLPAGSLAAPALVLPKAGEPRPAVLLEPTPPRSVEAQVADPSPTAQPLLISPPWVQPPPQVARAEDVTSPATVEPRTAAANSPAATPVAESKELDLPPPAVTEAPRPPVAAAPPPAMAEPSLPAAAEPRPSAVAPPAATPNTCQVCGLALADSARFCGHCGANVAAYRQAAAAPAAQRTCPSCQGKLAPSAKFCAFCGYRVG